MSLLSLISESASCTVIIRVRTVGRDHQRTTSPDHGHAGLDQATFGLFFLKIFWKKNSA
jgi:hypothetical protein